jgi:hypothetical protein
LEKKKKVHKHKHLLKKHKSSTKESEDEILDNIEFPEDGMKVVMTIFDRFKQKSIYFEDWIRFIR